MTWYLGCWAKQAIIEKLVEHICKQVGLAANYGAHFPIIVKSGTNEAGQQVDFIFNYSDEDQQVALPTTGTELLSNQAVVEGDKLSLQPWAVKIIEEKK